MISTLYFVPCLIGNLPGACNVCQTEGSLASAFVTALDASKSKSPYTLLLLMPQHNLLRTARAVLIFAWCLNWLAPAQQPSANVKFPCPEKLSYQVQWHGISAGLATVSIAQPKADEWQTTLNLESAGMVARLYHVFDKYKSITSGKFCGASSELDAQEGKHHKIEKLSFDAAQKRIDYYEHDVVKNQDARKQLDAPPCTFEITGALHTLRAMDLEPGKTITLPLTDGKKLANARIDAQAKENVTLTGRTTPRSAMKRSSSIMFFTIAKAACRFGSRTTPKGCPCCSGCRWVSRSEPST